MESAGISINTQELEAFSKILNKNLEELKETMYSEAGVSFNIDSPKQLGDVLFGQMKLDEKLKKQKQVNLKQMKLP